MWPQVVDAYASPDGTMLVTTAEHDLFLTHWSRLVLTHRAAGPPEAWPEAAVDCQMSDPGIDLPCHVREGAGPRRENPDPPHD